MKPTVALILAAALTAGNASAQGGPPAGKPAMGLGKGMMDEKQTVQMRERMKIMQAQMDRIHKTADPAERRKLMQEHMQSMRDGMDMMRGMGGPMMGGKGDGMAMMGDPKQRQDMMERRMDMMQMMMEQMMQHQQHMSPPTPAK